MPPYKHHASPNELSDSDRFSSDEKSPATAAPRVQLHVPRSTHREMASSRRAAATSGLPGFTDWRANGGGGGGGRSSGPSSHGRRHRWADGKIGSGPSSSSERNIRDIESDVLAQPAKQQQTSHRRARAKAPPNGCGGNRRRASATEDSSLPSVPSVATDRNSLDTHHTNQSGGSGGTDDTGGSPATAATDDIGTLPSLPSLPSLSTEHTNKFSNTTQATMNKYKALYEAMLKEVEREAKDGKNKVGTTWVGLDSVANGNVQSKGEHNRRIVNKSAFHNSHGSSSGQLLDHASGISSRPNKTGSNGVNENYESRERVDERSREKHVSDGSSDRSLNKGGQHRQQRRRSLSDSGLGSSSDSLKNSSSTNITTSDERALVPRNRDQQRKDDHRQQRRRSSKAGLGDSFNGLKNSSTSLAAIDELAIVPRTPDGREKNEDGIGSSSKDEQKNRHRRSQSNGAMENSSGSLRSSSKNIAAIDELAIVPRKKPLRTDSDRNVGGKISSASASNKQSNGTGSKSDLDGRRHQQRPPSSTSRSNDKPTTSRHSSNSTSRRRSRSPPRSSPNGRSRSRNGRNSDRGDIGAEKARSSSAARDRRHHRAPSFNDDASVGSHRSSGSNRSSRSHRSIGSTGRGGGRRRFSANDDDKDDDLRGDLDLESNNNKLGQEPTTGSSANAKKGTKLLHKIKKLAGKVKTTLGELGGTAGVHKYKLGEVARYRVHRIPRHCEEEYDAETRTVEVEIVTVHVDAVLEMPYYTIQLPDRSRKQTNWDNLMPLSEYKKRKSSANTAAVDGEDGDEDGEKPRSRSRLRFPSRSRGRSLSKGPVNENGGGNNGNEEVVKPRSRSRSRLRFPSRNKVRSLSKGRAGDDEEGQDKESTSRSNSRSRQQPGDRSHDQRRSSYRGEEEDDTSTSSRRSTRSASSRSSSRSSSSRHGNGRGSRGRTHTNSPLSRRQKEATSTSKRSIQGAPRKDRSLSPGKNGDSSSYRPSRNALSNGRRNKDEVVDRSPDRRALDPPVMDDRPDQESNTSKAENHCTGDEVSEPPQKAPRPQAPRTELIVVEDVDEEEEAAEDLAESFRF